MLLLAVMKMIEQYWNGLVNIFPISYSRKDKKIKSINQCDDVTVISPDEPLLYSTIQWDDTIAPYKDAEKYVAMHDKDI